MGAAVMTVAPAPGPAPVPPAAAPELWSTASLTRALRAGWILSDLLGALTEPPSAGASPPVPDCLPARPGPLPAQLTQPTSTAALARQLQAKVSQLKNDLELAEVAKACWENINACLVQLTVSGRDLSPDDLVRAREAISNGLVAASTRLGRAFDLGYDLSTVCRLPDDAGRSQLDDLLGARSNAVQQALADLSSALPEHAGRSVSLSLAVWQHWAEDPQLSRRPVSWPNPSVGRALARQGEVWGSVLSGEKLGKDMLGTKDYAQAFWSLVRGVFTRWWVWVIVVVTVAAASGGVYLLVAQKGTWHKVLGAILTGLGAAGIRLASLKRMLGDVAADLENEAWGAELDRAIANAVTVPPGDWRLDVGSREVELPPPRGVDPRLAERARTIHVLSRRSRGELHEPHSTRRMANTLYRWWRTVYRASFARITWLRERRVRQFLDAKCALEAAAGQIVPNGQGARNGHAARNGHGGPGGSSGPGDQGGPGGQADQGDQAAGWHLDQRERISHALVRLELPDYVELACGSSDRLVAHHGPDGPSIVWTFHNNKIRHIALFKDYDAACAEAAELCSLTRAAGAASE